MDRTLSAPGKLFLAGEYAVLWGGEARILGTAPRAHALVRSRQDRRVEIALVTRQRRELKPHRFGRDQAVIDRTRIADDFARDVSLERRIHVHAARDEQRRTEE